MGNTAAANPALTVALALAAGIVAQSLARHLGIPGIVLLLAAGAVLGPDLLDVVRPGLLGAGLPMLVGFAVAVILFEGGMNLNFRRLWREAGTIRRLVTAGAVITAAGAAVVARLLMPWDWRTAILFGTLVIVTGPTVITPLLRRVRVTQRLHTVLEAEGVFIDAVGAIIAVAALEVAISPSGSSLAAGLGAAGLRFGLGTALGLAGGFVIAVLLRPRRLVPEGLENVFTLALVLVLFQVSNVVAPESGIVAAAVAGVVVGNFETRVRRELMEFKEQLTVLLVGMLFVLLAADVRLEEVRSLGWPGVWTVAALMFVVRPLDVAACTWGSDLSLRERAFLAWLAPRGIVAAAVASLFAETLSEAGLAGGEQLRAMVFLVIAVTVLVQGLSGGLVARLLGVRRKPASGYLVLGAHPLALALGRLLRQAGEDVAFVDTNPGAVAEAEEAEFKVVWGNGLEERTLLRAEIEAYAAVVGLTFNDEVNLLFAQRAREEFKVPRAYVALRDDHYHVNAEMVHREGGVVLFGDEAKTEYWAVELGRDAAHVEAWELANEPSDDEVDEDDEADEAGAVDSLGVGQRDWLLPLLLQRGRRTMPFSDETALRRGDRLWLVLRDRHEEEAELWLRRRGFVRAASTE